LPVIFPCLTGETVAQDDVGAQAGKASPDMAFNPPKLQRMRIVAEEDRERARLGSRRGCAFPSSAASFSKAVKEFADVRDLRDAALRGRGYGSFCRFPLSGAGLPEDV